MVVTPFYFESLSDHGTSCCAAFVFQVTDVTQSQLKVLVPVTDCVSAVLQGGCKLPDEATKHCWSIVIKGPLIICSFLW